MLSDVCLSVAYIGPKSRTERPRKTKIGTEVDTTFKVKRSKVKVISPLCSPPCWRVRRLQLWAWERVGRGKLSTLPSARRRMTLRRPRGRRGAGAYCGGRPPTACFDCALYKFMVDTSRPLVCNCLHSSDWMSKQRWVQIYLEYI